MLQADSALGVEQAQAWETYLEKAERAVSEGELKKAVEYYEFGLRKLLVAQETIKSTTRKAELMALKSETEVALASLLVSGAPAVAGDPIPRVEQLYRDAIKSTESQPVLRARACNDYGVFLLQVKRPKAAEIVLASLENGLFKVPDGSSQSPSQGALDPLTPADGNVLELLCGKVFGPLELDNRFLSVYLYNYGRSLEQNGKSAEALDRYLSSFLRDPTFRPAEDAAARSAQVADAGQGIDTLRILSERSLDDASLTFASRHLRTIIQKKEWAKNPKLLEALPTLVRLFTLESLGRERFKDTWKGELADLSARSTSEVAARLDSILKAYAGDWPLCMGHETLRRDYRVWGLRGARVFSDFLKMLADQAVQSGEEDMALNGYLLSACLDSRNEENNRYLANLLLISPGQRERLMDFDMKLSPLLHAAMGLGYAALEEKTLASQSFRNAARLSDSEESIDAYMERAIDFALPDQRAILVSEWDLLVAKLRPQEDVITVAGEIGGSTRLSVASFHAVPNSRGSLSLASLVVPSLISHLCTTDTESNQKEATSFAGASSANGSVAVDQIIISDLVEPETAPIYYAIDALESVDIVAGGTGTTRSSSGLHVNLETKNPSHRWLGSGSYSFLPEFVNETLGRPDVKFAPTQDPVTTNRIRDNNEFGLQAGGDFIRDKLSAWVSYNESDLSMSAFGGDPYEEHLETAAFKLLSAFSEKDSVMLSSSSGEGLNNGVGAGLTRSRDTTLNQRSDSEIWKLEYGWAYHQWELVGYHSNVRSALSFSPSLSSADMLLGPSGIWHGSFRSGSSESDSEQTEIRSTYSYPAEERMQFKSTLSLGGQSRRIRSAFESIVGRSNSAFIAGENFDIGFDIARFYRSGLVRTDERYDSLWVQETLGFKRYTLDLGLRYDRQRGWNRGASVAGNPAVPVILPAVETGGAQVIDWESLLPRVGAAYKSSDKMTLRASYSRFASALQTRYVQRSNAAFPSYAQFGFEDSDGDDVLGPDESGSLRFLAPFGFDPRNAGAGSANAVDPNLKPEITDEGVLGIERKLAGGVEVGLFATYRRVSRILELRDFVRDGNDGAIRLANRGDYVFDRFETVELPDGSPSTVSSFTLRPGLAFAGGSLLVNGDRTQEYLGIRLNLIRPLGQRGNLRGVIAYEDSRWHIGPRFLAFDDPTDAGLSLDPSGVSRADNDGDIVIPQGPRFDSHSSPLGNAKWSFNLNGSFELWKRMMVGANVNYRDGSPLPYFATTLSPDGLEREIQVVPRSDSFRLPDLLVFDLRLQRTFTFSEAEVTVSLDGFNMLNKGTALQRIRQLNGPQPDFLSKTLHPRTIRIGLQVALENTH